MNVLPQPQQVTLLEGTTTLVSPLRVFAWEWQDEVAAWAEDLAKSTRIDVEFVDIDEADIVFSLASDIDGYRLVIDGAVHILCSWSDGVTQALTTLRQLGPVELYSAEQLPISSFDVPN